MQPRRVNPWLVLVIVGLAQFMVILDATIVNVALPSIQRGLHFSPESLQWIVNAYTLAFGSLLLLGGRIADYVGRRRMFVIGLIGFGAASALGGLAQDQAMLFGARAQAIEHPRLAVNSDRAQVKQRTAAQIFHQRNAAHVCQCYQFRRRGLFSEARNLEV